MIRTTILLLSLSLAAAAQEKLVGGPFVVNVGPRAATVCWLVQSSEVKLGVSPDQLTTAAPVLRSHKVTYAGLKPGATYHYNVTGTEAGKGWFKTPPEGDVPFNFVVYGDTRTRHELHQKVVDAVVKVKPDFVAHTGDLVSDGGDTALWPIFFNISKELLRQTVFFPSLGNHERNNPQYYEFFDVKTAYYSFNWGNSHFTFLNSDLGNVAMSASAKEQYWAEQKRWMEDDLKKAQKAAFRFMIFHHPPFTAVKKRQGGNKEVTALVPLFEQYNVTAIFNGHDHNYQRHLKNGIHYIVTGGGGAPLYPVDGPIEGLTQKVLSTEHFVQVQVAGKTAHIRAVALDGTVIEEIDLK